MRVVILFALLISSVSCNPPTDSHSPLPWGDPEQTGMSSEGLGKIRPAMQRYIDEGLTGGIVTIVARRGALVHWDAVGFRDIESGESLQPDDIVRICSMSKPITSVAVMMLVEEGSIALDDSIGSYLPELVSLPVYTGEGLVPSSSPITIADLLSHTSGFTYGPFGDTHVDSIYRAEDVFSGDLENLVDEVGGLPLLGQPGAVWNYGVSTDVLGRLVEVVSGQALDEFLKQRMFLPLGMEDTDFWVPQEKKHRFATVYATTEDGSLEETETPICGSYDTRPELLSGGGGMVSTAADYLRFAQMVLNGGELDGVRLLAPETVEIMRKNRLPDDLIPIRIGAWEANGYGFGLGFSVLVDAEDTPTPDTDGVFRWSGYASTFFWIDPTEELVGVLMTQLAPATHPEVEVDFQTLVYEAIGS